MADRDNQVYMGTVVEEGSAKIIIIGTGIETEIGHITKLVKDTKEKKLLIKKN